MDFLPRASPSEPGVSSQPVAPSFATLLRLYRRRFGLTQEVLAERAAYSVETIKKLEGGSRKPSKILVDVLAAVLELEPEDRSFFSDAGAAMRVQGLIPVPQVVDGPGPVRMLGLGGESAPKVIQPAVETERAVPRGQSL